MQLKTYCRPITAEDMEIVHNLKLRQKDIDELYASTGLPPKEALIQCVDSLKNTWVVIHNDKIEGVFGVHGYPFNSTIGVPWFLATDEFDNFRFWFARYSITGIKIMLDEHPILINLIDARQKDSIEWLKWLGFTVTKENKTTIRGVDFVWFIKCKEPTEREGDYHV